MALGTIDSVKHIERCLKLGTIEITETSYGWQVKGDTYPVKEYLKKEFDAHWNKDAQAWDIVVMDCYSDGRNHYHYTLLNDACKPAEPEPEQPEQTEPETADDETIAYEIDVYEMQATLDDCIWHIEPKTANGSFEPIDHIELTESDVANGYMDRAIEVVAHTQPTEEVNESGDYIEFRDVVLYSRAYDADGQLVNEEMICRERCLSDAAKKAIYLNKAL